MSEHDEQPLPFPVTEEGLWVLGTNVLTYIAVGIVTGEWDIVLTVALPQLAVGIGWQVRRGRNS